MMIPLMMPRENLTQIRSSANDDSVDDAEGKPHSNTLVS